MSEDRNRALLCKKSIFVETQRLHSFSSRAVIASSMQVAYIIDLEKDRAMILYRKEITIMLGLHVIEDRETDFTVAWMLNRDMHELGKINDYGDNISA